MSACSLNTSELSGYMMIAMIAILFIGTIIGSTLKYFSDRKQEKECNERLRAAVKKVVDSY